MPATNHEMPLRDDMKMPKVKFLKPKHKRCKEHGMNKPNKPNLLTRLSKWLKGIMR